MLILQHLSALRGLWRIEKAYALATAVMAPAAAPVTDYRVLIQSTATRVALHTKY